MNIELRFFASVREALGTSTEVVTLPPQVKTIGDVRAFLGHKPGLNADDHELLDLMAAHAASALVAARAFHVSQRKLNAYEGLLGFMRGGAS